MTMPAGAVQTPEAYTSQYDECPTSVINDGAKRREIKKPNHKETRDLNHECQPTSTSL
jgi:hypothetical protein